MSQETYEEILRLIIRRTFPLWEALGFHVTLNYWEEPVPDTRTLGDAIWNARTELVGIRMNGEAQLKLLSTFKSRYKGEYDAFPPHRTSDPHEFHLYNHSFESVDAEVLYCMIRHFKPKRVIEIGSGNSTLLSAQAIRANQVEDKDYSCEFTAIEPFPREFAWGEVPGLTRRVREKVEDVPLSEFEALGENDILFIDSSHILRIDNDVRFEYLEILPRLKRGVLIHCHDIFLPLEYPRNWYLKDHRFYTEQYLLQAFLAFNDAFEVIWGSTYMVDLHPDLVEEAFRSFERGKWLPGSLWMRRTA